jgi:hypothetical protein
MAESSTPPVVMRHGILKVWYVGTYLADVQLVGSLTTWLKSIPVARDIASAEMTAGRSVLVAMLDDANPADAAVIAVWV